MNLKIRATLASRRAAIVSTGIAAVLAAGLLASCSSKEEAVTRSGSGVPVASAVDKPVPFDAETLARQKLVEVALARAPADLVIRGARVLNVFTSQWDDGQDIVISGERIAWVGKSGDWKGKTKKVFDARGLTAVPGFGESHKHIESTLLSPEYEAALVVPLGNTWTSEGSHEFSNVSGEHNVEFWETAGKHGSPLKIFTALGSATPPSAFEKGGGSYAYQEIYDNMNKSLSVQGLDEVMDWPAVSRPEHPGHQRIWENIQATRNTRGVIDGHGAGLTEHGDINAFAATGLTSDHETRAPEEAWEKLQHGLFMQLKNENIERALPYFKAKGLTDWSNIALVTDDRNVADTLRLGTMDAHVRQAIQMGVPTIAAYQMATINPARHAHMDSQVGAIAPGRYADVVLLSSVDDVQIKHVFANGKLAATDGKYLLPIPKIDWPKWATDTINIGRKLTADDFVIRAPEGRTTVTAAIQEPRYRDPVQRTATLPVVNGVVQRDIAHDIIKFAMIDRYTGQGKLAKVFYTGLGPKTPNSAIASSVSHDLHDVAVVGSSDAAMAMAANRVAELKGGIVLVRNGKIVGEIKLEVGGLMTSRPIPEAAADLEKMWAQGDTMEWIGAPGFPKGIIAMMITCSPYTWRLVVPYPGNPDGLVLLQTGETMPIIK
ncbi:adenine deaminase [Sphingomonas sp.]|uniref:adenine deaminase n=1 Tax=Sphingomonas sp. TaxID=28214 RepID=UPI000DB7C092|nr:adenine deaminase C-terminal domain-containing protein [Sphingomonas sp.]PZU10219.1 MAG: adenosine deaminase [Sphingomonas sp.]